MVVWFPFEPHTQTILVTLDTGHFDHAHVQQRILFLPAPQLYGFTPHYAPTTSGHSPPACLNSTFKDQGGSLVGALLCYPRLNLDAMPHGQSAHPQLSLPQAHLRLSLTSVQLTLAHFAPALLRFPCFRPRFTSARLLNGSLLPAWIALTPFYRHTMTYIRSSYLQ